MIELKGDMKKKEIQMNPEVNEYFRKAKESWGSIVRPVGNYQVVDDETGRVILMHRGYCRQCKTLFQVEMEEIGIVKCLHCGYKYEVDVG